MTAHDAFDRTLAGWFVADALSPAPAANLDRVIDATRRRRPLPAWLAGPGSHWVGEAPAAGSGVRSLPRVNMRWSTALMVLLAIAALVGAALLVGARLLHDSPPTTDRLGHLAYSLDGDIFVADWDGRNPARIADGNPIVSGWTDCGSFAAFGAMWSPDGRHLAYRSDFWGDPCSGTVYLSDPAGHVVASFPGTGRLVSWSPDSIRVATWVELSKTIGIYGLDGVRQALLTLPPGYGVPGDFDPIWSPDGRSLLIKLSLAAPTEVWEIPVDGGTSRPVPKDDPRSDDRAAFSRDGARVAFHEAGFLVVAAADGTGRRLLAQSSYAGRSIVWSTKGDRVAWAWGFEPDPGNLRVMDVSSGVVWEVASGSQIEPVRFSSDGDRILFTAIFQSKTSLLGANVDGPDGRPLFRRDDEESSEQLLVQGAASGDWQWQPGDQ
jgi:hypothetical protein